MRYFYVYILSDNHNKVLYTGFTNNLLRRVKEHKDHIVEGFTSRYNVDKLVYYEEGLDSYGAICREKQIKGYVRFKKRKMINAFNPEWNDLYYKIVDEMNK